ncbi:universal stress protein [Nocardia mangyaensis]|uniref:universal stress protein n=1 Tax=Nocardia mangyaensis TaxID=2213200 RepID=UPI00267505BA|nr:universal stress protein [Nocardia mangyaensis]MDO3646290.1 universal stress protein [Nocardia mangyaensis]
MSLPVNPNPPVVVGIDGSEQARTALNWAAAFAAHHRAPLRLICVIDVPMDYGPGVSAPLFDHEALRRHAETLLADATSRAAAITDTDITTTITEGAPVLALGEYSESARLLVVGSRGLGAFRRTLLGSVSSSLARRAACPVAVIPEHEFATDGPVVVGVDGSECSVAAVATAFDEAAHRNARLIAVHTWSEFYHYESRATMQTAAEAVLSESLAGYGEKYPDVRVDRRVVEDRPARAVLEAAENAQLIVVGSRGRGGFAGMALGSVAQAVLHGAECPLIIIRSANQS